MMGRSDFACVHQVLTFARRQQEARGTWSSTMSTYLPENIRFLRRFGADVLTAAAYRRQLRKELRRYVRFHARQCARLYRMKDKRFFGVHRTEVERILEEGGDDPEVQMAMMLVRTMLVRGGRAARYEPAKR